MVRLLCELQGLPRYLLSVEDQVDAGPLIVHRNDICPIRQMTAERLKRARSRMSDAAVSRG